MLILTKYVFSFNHPWKRVTYFYNKTEPGNILKPVLKTTKTTAFTLELKRCLLHIAGKKKHKKQTLFSIFALPIRVRYWEVSLCCSLFRTRNVAHVMSSAESGPSKIRSVRLVRYSLLHALLRSTSKNMRHKWYKTHFSKFAVK